MTERSESERAELPHWNDPDVQAIYKTLCDPVVEDGFKKQMYTDGGHWEGWVARNIASALRRLAAPDQKPVALDPLEMLLDAARYAEGNGGKYRNPEWAKAARAAVAKARLSAPGQKPVAWRYRYEAWPDPDHWAATIGDPSRFNNQSQLIYEPLYLSPPPAAGWDEAIEEALKVVEPWRHSPSPNFMYVADAIYRSLEALRHNAPPDSGAGESTEVQSEYERGFEAGRKSWGAIIEQHKAHTAELENTILPDHGGADAVVKLKRLLTAAKILQQNAVACATNHYGHDCELNGLPGWLNDTQKDIEASEVAANASAEARDFCTYGPPDERKRQWIIVFEDADRGMMIFSDEREAHTAWDKAKDNWTCTLFETSERKYHWAAGELRPLNASAEARLREALEPFAVLGRSLYEANQRSDQSVLIGASAEFLNLRPLIGQHFVNAHLALSAHPHASDCDKQGER